MVAIRINSFLGHSLRVFSLVKDSAVKFGSRIMETIVGYILLGAIRKGRRCCSWLVESLSSLTTISFRVVLVSWSDMVKVGSRAVDTPVSPPPCPCESEQEEKADAVIPPSDEPTPPPGNLGMYLTTLLLLASAAVITVCCVIGTYCACAGHERMGFH
jgi:hypothetical protein